MDGKRSTWPFDQARQWRRDAMCVHLCQGEGAALDLYRRFGLEPTGRVDNDVMFLKGPISER